MAFDPPPMLETPRLCLRLVRQSDLPALMAINGDAVVTRFLPYPTWRDAADAQAWWERIAPASASGAALQFVVIEKATGSLIGACLLFNHEAGSARADIGYVTRRTHWQRGLTFEAVAALIRHAFDGCGLRRLEAQADSANTASHALLLKLGFQCEGLLRQRWVHKGAAYDTHIYGLLASDRQPGWD